MLQLCVFGSQAGPLVMEKRCYLTVFGSCELRRPTLARQIASTQAVSNGKAPESKMIFLTVFGGTRIICPTLAEEYVDLRAAIESGHLELGRWESYLVELEKWQSSAYLSLTLFASLEDAHLPSEDQEVETLALQRHFGRIGEQAGRILEMGVGQRGAARRSIIQEAVLAD